MNQLHHRGLKATLVGSLDSSGPNSRHTHNRLIRAGVLLRRGVPVPGILATHRPGALMDKSGRHFVARYAVRR